MPCAFFICGIMSQTRYLLCTPKITSNHIMAYKEIQIKYPAGIPQMLKMSDVQFAAEIRFLAAAKLYETGRLTAGKAAELAGLSRMAFLTRLADVQVPAINLQDDEIEAEIEAARTLGK